MPPEPTDDYETKARHLRWLYRQNCGPDQYRIVRAEYDRLFPEAEVRLDQILVNAWIEGRQLAGWTYDVGTQCWRRADGSPVLNDDGSEWAHL